MSSVCSSNGCNLFQVEKAQFKDSGNGGAYTQVVGRDGKVYLIENIGDAQMLEDYEMETKEEGLQRAAEIAEKAKKDDSLESIASRLAEARRLAEPAIRARQERK